VRDLLDTGLARRWLGDTHRLPDLRDLDRARWTVDHPDSSLALNDNPLPPSHDNARLRLTIDDEYVAAILNVWLLLRIGLCIAGAGGVLVVARTAGLRHHFDLRQRLDRDLPEQRRAGIRRQAEKLAVGPRQQVLLVDPRHALRLLRDRVARDQWLRRAHRIDVKPDGRCERDDAIVAAIFGRRNQQRGDT
jgi:hypothetical protein